MYLLGTTAEMGHGGLLLVSQKSPGSCMGRNQESIDATITPAQIYREDLSVSEMVPNLLLKPMGRERCISRPIQPRLATFSPWLDSPLNP